jgi:hypothetical protein
LIDAINETIDLSTSAFETTVVADLIVNAAVTAPVVPVVLFAFT